MRTDNQIQQDVIAQLKYEPFLNAAEIGVTVKNGIVTLSGTVDSFYKKVGAEQVARKVAGVRAVAEEIRVQVAPVVVKTDAEIAEAVVSALAWHTLVQEKKINIVVENGVVILEGTADWHFQREAAFDAIKGLAGVREVRNNILVRPTVKLKDVQKNIMRDLHRHATTDAQKVSVDVVGSKIILRGTVRSQVEKEDVEYAAWCSPGVHGVDNQLVVEELEEIF